MKKKLPPYIQRKPTAVKLYSFLKKNPKKKYSRAELLYRLNACNPRMITYLGLLERENLIKIEIDPKSSKNKKLYSIKR